MDYPGLPNLIPNEEENDFLNFAPVWNPIPTINPFQNLRNRVSTMEWISNTYMRILNMFGKCKY